MAETILLKRKITGGGVQLADLANNEIAFDEATGLLVRKRNDGSAIDIYGKLGAINNADLTTALANYYTQAEVNGLISGAGGGDMLAANNLNEVDPASARTNLDTRSTAQITTEITNAIATINLSGLGGLNLTEVDARADARIAAQFSAAPAAYDTLQKIFQEMADDDTETAGILSTLGNKIDVDGTIDGGTIS